MGDDAANMGPMSPAQAIPFILRLAIVGHHVVARQQPSREGWVKQVDAGIEHSDDHVAPLLFGQCRVQVNLRKGGLIDVAGGICATPAPGFIAMTLGNAADIVQLCPDDIGIVAQARRCLLLGILGGAKEIDISGGQQGCAWRQPITARHGGGEYSCLQADDHFI